MRFCIRHASPDDHGLIDALIDRVDADWPRQDLGQINSNELVIQDLLSQQCAFVVHDGGGDLVGFVRLVSVMLSTGERGWVALERISVDPRAQGHGIGRLLMEKIQTWLVLNQAQGCLVVGMPAFFRRFGWRPYDALVFPGAVRDEFQVLLVNARFAPSATVIGHPAFFGLIVTQGHRRS